MPIKKKKSTFEVRELLQKTHEKRWTPLRTSGDTPGMAGSGAFFTPFRLGRRMRSAYRLIM
jgi:hypothetical protein